MEWSLLFRCARFALPLFASSLFLCAGCDQGGDSVIVYRAPKETPAPGSKAQATAMNSAAPAGVHWNAVAGWEEQPASGFRKGSYVVRGADGKTADVSIISFPEAAGGVLANINRWRDQMKLAPVADEAQAGTALAVDGHDILFVDLVSEQPITPGNAKSRILGGILPLTGETWFFKMMGPDALVESQRVTFKEFLQGVHVAHPAESAHPSITTNAGGSGSTNAPTPPMLEAAAAPPLQFTLPPGWKEKPLTPMRVASFNVTAPNGKQVDISVVSLVGEAGGDLANVNRWREQVKLPPIEEAALQQSAEHVEENGHDFLVVDLASAEPIGEPAEKQRIIAAILDDKGRSWFIKMTGEEAAVASQKSAFADFLRTLQFH
ncbi:MAG: hypothetical protein ABI946_00415 [Chthoniobacterales bacterium]